MRLSVVLNKVLNSSKTIPILKPIRGQVSWVENSQRPLALDQAYSYGGYCMQLDAAQLILGASFIPIGMMQKC